MGSVKIDVHKADRQFELVSFSDIDCIKGLIKNRSKIDGYFKYDGDNHFDHAGIVKPINQELIVLYTDLDVLIERAQLNVKQRFIIDRLMEGFPEKEIADMFGQTARNINSNFDKACMKIKQLNDLCWKYNYIFLNNLRVTWDYKQCQKCSEHKPLIEEFFSPDSKNKDGFRNVCKACR